MKGVTRGVTRDVLVLSKFIITKICKRIVTDEKLILSNYAFTLNIHYECSYPNGHCISNLQKLLISLKLFYILNILITMATSIQWWLLNV